MFFMFDQNQQEEKNPTTLLKKKKVKLSIEIHFKASQPVPVFKDIYILQDCSHDSKELLALMEN